MSLKIFEPNVCIGGLPGIGSVGKVASDCIITELDCRTLEGMISPAFPVQVLLVDGVARPLQVELKVSEDRDDLLFLSGDAQPLTPRAMYHLAGRLLEKARSFGVHDFVTLAAYVGDMDEEIIGVATDLELACELDDAGFALLRSGMIGGLNGILVGLSPFYGMRGACLMANTSGKEMIDLVAAKNLIGVVGDILDIDVSTITVKLEGSGRPEDVGPTAPEAHSPSDDFQTGYI